MQPMNQRITQARKALGLTQEQVAEAMNVSRQTVSHWETGRVTPDEEMQQALFALLHIDADVKKKPRFGVCRLAVAFLCGVLTTLLVIFAILTLSEPKEEPTVFTEESHENSFSWEWFQEADVNDPDKAFIQMKPMESPVLLMEDQQYSSQYVWKIMYSLIETNGIPFTAERFTEVYFNQEHGVLDSYERVGEECKRFWPSLTFEGNSVCGYNANRPVGGSIGYGAVLEGRDANGHALTFKVYIPLSQEIRRTAHPDDFAKEAVPEEGKAFLRICATESPIPQVYDPVFEGDWGWKYEYIAENVTEVPFTIELVREVFFRGDVEAFTTTYDQAHLDEWGISRTVTAEAPYSSGGGANCLQALSGLGVSIEGVDSNGNALTFTQFLPFAQERAQE